jgi:hypothetical protein
LAEILAAIGSLPHCSRSSIVAAPALGADVNPNFVLLLFIGGHPGVEQAAVRKKILATIAREMGKEFFPDRIQFFPLYPRGDDEGNVDHHWCRDQYLTGSLFRKSREEMYRSLAQLREYLV